MRPPCADWVDYVEQAMPLNPLVVKVKDMMKRSLPVPYTERERDLTTLQDKDLKKWNHLLLHHAIVSQWFLKNMFEWCCPCLQGGYSGHVSTSPCWVFSCLCGDCDGCGFDELGFWHLKVHGRRHALTGRGQGMNESGILASYEVGPYWLQVIRVITPLIVVISNYDIYSFMTKAIYRGAISPFITRRGPFCIETI